MAHARFQFLDEARRDIFLDDEAGARATDLTLIEPDRVHHALNGRVQIGIFEHDDGTLAPQLQRNLFPRPRGEMTQRAPDLGGTREGDLVHVGVRDDHLARLATARDDVDHAWRKSRLGDDLREQQRAQPRVRRGF